MRVGEVVRRWWDGWRQRASAPDLDRLSLWGSLHRYISGPELARISAATPDRRALVGAVAAFVGVEEGVILGDWCVRRGFEYLERIPVADFSVLRAPLTSEILHGYGATVVTEGDEVVRIVCIDPDQIDWIREHLAGISVAVTRWDEIRRHLEESSRLAEELAAARIQEAVERLRETTEAVIGLVVHEVIDRGLSAVTVDLSGEDPTYAIIDGGRTRARGFLHAMLRPALRELLAGERLEIVMPSGARRTVDVSRDPDSERFRLAWLREPIPYQPSDEISAGMIADSLDTVGARSPQGGGERTLFVIDDNPGFSDIVRRYLERHGFCVRAFQSAESAWIALEEGVELDLIVCDVHMPGMNGYDFIRRLRATTVGRAVPIIALTSDDEVETEIRLIQAGVSAFVSKSADPRILCAHVERWSRREGD